MVSRFESGDRMAYIGFIGWLRAARTRGAKAKKHGKTEL
jgi:hypothetical protein